MNECCVINSPNPLVNFMFNVFRKSVSILEVDIKDPKVRPCDFDDADIVIIRTNWLSFRWIRPFFRWWLDLVYNDYLELFFEKMKYKVRGRDILEKTREIYNELSTKLLTTRLISLQNPNNITLFKDQIREVVKSCLEKTNS